MSSITTTNIAFSDAFASVANHLDSARDALTKIQWENLERQQEEKRAGLQAELDLLRREKIKLMEDKAALMDEILALNDKKCQLVSEANETNGWTNNEDSQETTLSVDQGNDDGEDVVIPETNDAEDDRMEDQGMVENQDSQLTAMEEDPAVQESQPNIDKGEGTETTPALSLEDTTLIDNQEEELDEPLYDTHEAPAEKKHEEEQEEEEEALLDTQPQLETQEGSFLDTQEEMESNENDNLEEGFTFENVAMVQNRPHSDSQSSSATSWSRSTKSSKRRVPKAFINSPKKWRRMIRTHRLQSILLRN